MCSSEIFLYILLLKSALFVCDYVLSRTLFFFNLQVVLPVVVVVVEALIVPVHKIELCVSHQVKV